MKNNLNKVWRIAIAIVLVIGLSMTMAMPVAAEVEATNVDCITIYSPATDCPVMVEPGDCFDITFCVQGAGVGEFAVLLGSNVIYVSSPVTFPIQKTTISVTVPEEIHNDIYDLTVAAGRSGQSPLTMPSAVNELSVIVDDTTPELCIVSPEDGAYVRDIVTIAAEAFDCASGVACVQFAYYDNEDLIWVNIDGPSTCEPYHVNWDTTCVPDGTYDVRAIATDRAGFSSEDQITVIVDNTCPTAPIVISPNGGESWQNGQDYDIKWITPVDDNFGDYPISINLYKDGSHYMEIASGLAVAGPYNWSISGIEPGCDYKVVIKAIDLAGNCTSDASDKYFSIYTVDNSKPSVDLTVAPVYVIDSVDFLTGKVDLSADAVDTDSGIGNVQFAYSLDDGCNWQTIGVDYVAPYEMEFDTTCLPDGAILIQAIAYNTAGAWDTDTDSFILDNSAPEVCLKGPASGIYPDGVVLKATASDAQSGINKVVFFYSINGCDWFEIGTAAFEDGIYFYKWTGMDEGTYCIAAEATNGVCIEKDSNVISNIVIDYTAPTTPTVKAPNGGEIWEIGKSYNINWTTPSDAHLGSNPITLELYKDGDTTPSWSKSGLKAAGPYCWTIENIVPGENYLMKVIATDLAGNKSFDYSNAYFTIWGEDCTGPSVTLTNPPDNSCFKDLIKVTADACDAESGIQGVVFEYSVDNGATWIEIGSDTCAPYFVNWDISELNYCDVLVSATATNGVGLSCSDVNCGICLDNVAPCVTINEIVCTSNAFPVITGTASDNCKVAVVKVSIFNEDIGKFWNGCEWVDECTWFAATGTDMWCLDASCVPFATDTHYVFSAIAFDCAGNATEKDKIAHACVFCPTDKINLAPGWNFISIPDEVIADYDTFGELLAGVNYKVAYAYEPCVGWIPLTYDSPVEVLTGYWIYVPQSCVVPNVIKVRYDVFSNSVPATKCLTGDSWNAIGPTGDKFNDCKLAAEELLSITTTTVPNLGSWTTLVAWDNMHQQYEESILFPGMTSMMVTGKGYWIFISNGAGDVLSESSVEN